MLTKLPDDLLSHILCFLPLAHDIARTAKTSRRLKRAAELAFAARPYSPEVLTLAGIMPYETALGQGVESAMDKVAESESALKDVVAQINDVTATINSFEATIASARARIDAENTIITNARLKIRTQDRRRDLLFPLLCFRFRGGDRANSYYL